MSIKKNIRRFFLLPVILLTVLASSFVQVSAEPGANLSLSVKAGYDDTVKIGFSVPFNIGLKNSGEDVSGELQIIVNSTPDSRSVYSTPFTLPKGSNKDFIINVPVYTIDRSIEVKLVSGGKTLKEAEYEFKKFISPDTPVIGAVSDEQNSIKGLGEINLSDQLLQESSSEEAMKRMAMAAAGEKSVVSNKLAEPINLNSKNFPEDIKALAAFDILVISNFDTTALNEKQISCLEKWVDKGNMLFIGTGQNWKKVYSGLPDTLKPFKIEGTEKLASSPALGSFTGKQPPAGSLDIAKGISGNGTVAAKEGDSPLIVHYKLGAGSISILTFDPSFSPISNWDELQSLWKNTFSSASSAFGTNSATGVSSIPNTYMNLNYLVTDVPESQTPPYKFLLIMIGIYIVVTGPVLYLLLKWKDKRDWSWVAIPLMALLFLGTIYIVGFKTRFNTAVLNNLSIIDMSPGLDKYNINTVMGVFNNKKGTMRLQYPVSSSMDINPNSTAEYGYYSSGQSTGKDGAITSKLSYSDPVIYEMYQARLWVPAVITANKTLPSKGELLSTVSLVDGKLKTVIKNTTGFPLKEAFIVIGDNYIEVGDIDPSEEKTVEALLGSPEVQLRLENFLNSRYGQNYNVSKADRTREWMENNRKRNILENILARNSGTTGSQAGIMLIAFNYDDPGYGLDINGQKPKTYNTNIVYSAMGMNLEKGSKITLPAGIVKAVFDQSKTSFASSYDISQGSIRVHEDADVDFTAFIPSNIKAGSIKILWENVIPAYIKYRSSSSPSQNYGKNVHKYFILNNTTGGWEEIASGHTIDKNASDYINGNNEIKLRANVTLDKNSSPGELLGTPDLEISGVVE